VGCVGVFYSTFSATSNTRDAECLSVTWLHSGNMAEQIDVLFRMRTPWAPRHFVLDGRPNHPMCSESDSMQRLSNYFYFLFYVAVFLSAGRVCMGNW